MVMSDQGLNHGKRKNPFGSTSSIQRNLLQSQTLSALGGQRGLCVVSSTGHSSPLELGCRLALYQHIKKDFRFNRSFLMNQAL
ncbi:hypothetical protein AKJ16_DCAP01967 [Drosera capensis]